ncbi:MAG: response regulator, partial [Planctomycetes bacterium]|nr:response regulator [Planctomycetota bacterium]
GVRMVIRVTLNPLSKSKNGPDSRDTINTSTTSRPSEIPTRRLSAKGGFRVLILDDDELVAEAMADMTTALGYEAVAFTEGRLALEYLVDHDKEVSLIVSDLSMPNLSGQEFAKHVEILDSEIPIVVATGMRDYITPELRNRRNIRECLQKPLSFPEFGEMLLRHVGPPEVAAV